MAEWFKAAVLKTVVRKYRGFESYLLRHFNTQARSTAKAKIRRGDREADGARLLSECTLTRTEGSNPSLSAILLFFV